MNGAHMLGLGDENISIQPDVPLRGEVSNKLCVLGSRITPTQNMLQSLRYIPMLISLPWPCHVFGGHSTRVQSFRLELQGSVLQIFALEMGPHMSNTWKEIST